MKAMDAIILVCFEFLGILILIGIRSISTYSAYPKHPFKKCMLLSFLLQVELKGKGSVLFLFNHCDKTLCCSTNTKEHLTRE